MDERLKWEIETDRLPIPVIRTFIALVKAAGGVQRVSVDTVLSLHTDDQLEVSHDLDTGDYIYRVTRRLPVSAGEKQ